MSARRRLIAGLIVLIAMTAGQAQAADRQMVLELNLNGRATGKVGEFIERGGEIYAKRSDLIDLGFAVPRVATPDDMVGLTTLPGVTATVDDTHQALVVTAPMTALASTSLQNQNANELAPITPARFGAVLNYDTSVIYDGSRATGGALMDMRVFGRFGAVLTSGLINFAPTGEQRSFLRLESTYQLYDTKTDRVWRAGDVVSGALPWSRAVRLGGGQVASDFSVRPDLVTYPLPNISAQAAVPSTVAIVVDGVRQFDGAVPPGPFQFRALPVVTGAGEVAVTIVDALGRQTVVTLPFYASAVLLKPGLASYSLEAGSVRRNFGEISNDYNGWAASGSLRYGLSDRLTLEGHAEAGNGLGLLGVGGDLQIGTIGVMSAAVSGSLDRDRRVATAPAPSTGGLVSLGFQHQSTDFSIALSASATTAGYRDVAAINGTAAPRATFTASASHLLGSLGDLGVAYTYQRQPATLDPANSRVAMGFQAEPFLTAANISIVTASYSATVAHRIAVNLSAFGDLGASHNYGVQLGFSIHFGSNLSAMTGVAVDQGGVASLVEVDKPAVREGQFGFRAVDNEGEASRRALEGEYLGRWGKASIGLEDSPNGVVGRAGLRGALAFIGGGVFGSDTINDSFAVVSTGGLGGVPVLYENRPFGTTDSGGHLLIPSLRAFENNKVEIDATQLPIDLSVGEVAHLIRPESRAGVVVDFSVLQSHGALVTLRRPDGHPVSLGSVARVQGEEPVPVGYDGQVYLTGLKRLNQVQVELAEGGACSVSVDYLPTKGDIPHIGPLLCK